MKFNLTFCLVSLLAIGCGKKNTDAQTAEDARQFRETDIVLESCDVEAKSAERIDANSDGKPEIVRVMNGQSEVCRTVDLNFDGKVDRTTYFDEGGKERRVESDFDRDGVVDEIAVFKGGVLSEKHRMTTMDGKLDTWEFFDNGKLARTERDEDGDGVIDQWWEYPSRGCPLIHMDADGDGRPDPGASIDYCKETGYTPPPLPGEADPPAEEPGFGEKDERVEELSNKKASEDTEAAGSPDGAETDDDQQTDSKQTGSSEEAAQ